MSVPLDRLYNYLHDIVNHDILIYRWNPHGSKKLEDLSLLICRSDQELLTNPIMICHDQEVLDYSYYQKQDYQKFYNQNLSGANLELPSHQEFLNQYQSLNFKALFYYNVYDKTLLTHSELNSAQVALYQQNGFLPVYFWSHAIIARDWFRYASHDVTLMNKNVKNLFLIYNRAWSGTREYRLSFADLLIKNDLHKLCRMGFNKFDNGQSYHTHNFKNPALGIMSTDLEKHFFENNTPSTASADYCVQDYQETLIEIVLETLFDDIRWHLTEKTLRPIACGQPFMLAATKGSLEYLRSYGFKTFSGLIDETYDTIDDPRQRLRAIVREMQRLASLGTNHPIWQQLQNIASYNQRHFFSDEFQQYVVDEYIKNLDAVMPEMVASCQGQSFKQTIEFAYKHFPDAGPELYHGLLDSKCQDVPTWVNQWLATHRL